MTMLPDKAMDAPPANEGVVHLPRASFCYGGVVLRFTADSGTAIAIPHEHWPYRVPDDLAADHEIRCSFGPITELAAPSVLSVRDADGDAWDVVRAGDGTEQVVLRTPVTLEPWLAVTTDPALRRSRYEYWPNTGEPGVVPLGQQVDQYLAARLLGRRGYALLHSCALLDDGGAFVFTGHSGAGKSTMSGLGREAGARILSDDRTIIGVRDGIVVAAGSPWQGSHRPGIPEFVPVRGIFLLTQAAENRVESLHPARAFAELNVRTVHPSTDPAELAAVVQVIERVATTAVVAELRFLPTVDAYRLARLAGAA